MHRHDSSLPKQNRVISSHPKSMIAGLREKRLYSPKLKSQRPGLVEHGKETPGVTSYFSLTFHYFHYTNLKHLTLKGSSASVLCR